MFGKVICFFVYRLRNFSEEDYRQILLFHRAF